MKRLVWLLILLFVLPVFSQDKPKKRFRNHAFSGTLMFGGEAGVTLGSTDYSDIRPDIMGRGILEYFFPTTNQGIFSIRAFAGGGYVGGKDISETPDVFRTNIFNIGGGISYTLSVQDVVFPFVFLGGSYLMFDPKDVNQNKLPGNAAGAYDTEEVNYHTEIGIRFLLADAINMSITFGGELSPNDNWDDKVASGNNDFMMYGLVGFYYSLFTEVDSDGDGVPDSKDQCPETPVRVKVDVFGCPEDTDMDGIPDYKDKCPNTKQGLEVDEFGCAVDSDADGVVDANDKCPNTPAGTKVNEYGCPDSDNDGVFDNEDKCPDTPANAPVDDNGCPKDSDNDGVADYKDKCPNTKAGQQVDENGCATEVVTLVKELVLRGDTNFEFNKAKLLPSAHDQLNKLAESMKNNPETRWRVIGHTDAIGSESYNMELSRDRAQSVVDYLINQGVSRDRLEIVAEGESDPIADNDTQEGRAMNRRVEIKLIEK